MRRNAFMLVELVASCFVLAVLLTLCLAVLRGEVDQCRAARERLVALQAAENLLEDLSARPWNELTPETAARLADEATRSLPEGRVEVEITEVAGSVGSPSPPGTHSWVPLPEGEGSSRFPSPSGRGQGEGAPRTTPPSPQPSPQPSPPAPLPEGEGRRIVAKRLSVLVQWRPDAARTEPSIRLVAWKYQPPKALP